MGLLLLVCWDYGFDFHGGMNVSYERCVFER